MKFNVAHTFTLEADSRADFDAKLQRYSAMVRRGSERLDIGYASGLMFGQPSVERSIEEPKPEERLFDG